jgi:ATP-dependent DNA helicase PIF1
MSTVKIHSVVLSPEQEYAMAKFRRGENIFLSGQAGTGKTELIKRMVEHAAYDRITCNVCAMTGCAAILLGNGATTLHSFAGIGLAKGSCDKVVMSVLSNKKKVARWCASRILIVDEVSMLSKKLFDLVERVARETRQRSGVFGGIQIIMTGDFMQLPPVETAGDIDSALFCFESSLWPRVFAPENHIVMTTVFRQADPVYRRILSDMRNGRISAESSRILTERTKAVFDPANHGGCVATKIFATRASVDHVNHVQYKKLGAEEHVYKYKISTKNRSYIDSMIPITPAKLAAFDRLSPEEVEFETKKLMDGSNMSPTLHLKVGTVVMCTVNLDIDLGICNGSQGVVVEMRSAGDGPAMEGKRSSELFPVVRFSKGMVWTMTRFERQSDEFPSISVAQVPLMHAWAVSIHKCQGATMDIAEIDVGRSIFECGQSYVALSRVKTLEGLYLSGFDPSRIKTHARARDFYARIPDIALSVHEMLRAESDRENDVEPTKSFDSFRFEESAKVLKNAPSCGCDFGVLPAVSLRDTSIRAEYEGDMDIARLLQASDVKVIRF